MTARQGAGVSFSVLLVALILAWQITKPEDRSHRPRVKPVVSPASATESGPAVRRGSRPASRVARRTQPRARTEGPPRIVGRVVTHRQRSPASGAQVKLVFSYAGQAREVTSIVSTGADGRFSAAIPVDDEPGSASIEVTDSRGFGKEDLDVFPPFRGMTDVGDVELSGMRKLWFHVTTAELVPIGDACAVAQPGRPGAIVRTDADGNGWIESSAPIESVRFVAQGFEPLDVPVPPGEDSLEVRLRSAVTARITITTAAGPLPFPGAFQVDVETPPDSYLVTPGDPFWMAIGNSRVGGRATRFLARANGVRGDLVTFHSSPITLGPLRPGTQMSVTVSEIFKHRAFRKDVDLPAAGTHDVEFVLPGDFGMLSGRVLDAAGKPVIGATVALLKTSLLRASNANGEFSFGAVPVDVYGLRVSSPAHACWTVREHPVEKDAKPLAITLEAGVTVTVTVLDQDGAPFHGVAVSALDRSGRTDVQGKVKLTHLPVGPVSFEAYSGGLRKVIDRHTSIPDVTIQFDPEDR
jgi:hypothetical protein